MANLKAALFFSLILTGAIFAQEVVTTTDTKTGVDTQVPVWLLGAVALGYNFVMSALQKFVYAMSPGLVQNLLKKLVDWVSANQAH